MQQFGDIQISGGTLIDASDFIPIKDGGGAIQIQGKNVTISDGSLIFAITYGPIKGENLVVNATESVKLSGSSNIATVTQGEGQAGDVLVKAGDSIELLETSFIASQVCSLLIDCESATGKGGNLTFETKRLLLQDGSGIEASTFGVGHGGNILAKATDSIDLIGETPDGSIPSGIFAQVGQQAIENSGDAGNINLETKHLNVRDGAQIFTAARYGGNGGNLTINVSDMIHLSGASPFATAELTDIYRSGIFVSAQPGATGNVGTLNINTGLLIVESGARITADNFGSGEAGIQKLNVRQLVIRDGGEVRSASFAEGSGGTLQINATDSVEVIGTGKINGTKIPSLLSTRTEGIGKAGDLIINSDVYDGLRLRLLVQDGAQVTVSSQGSGQVGKLEITTGSVKLDHQGKRLPQTTSNDGDPSRVPTNDIGIDPSLNSIVTINAPDIDSSWGSVQLLSNPVDASPQIELSCNMQASLTRGANIPNNQILEAQGWIIDAKGDIVLVAQASTVNPLLQCP